MTDSERLFRLVESSGLSVAVAESLTSGHLQALIGAVSGVSKVFAGGICAYSLDQKELHLSVDRAIAEPVNCVSEEVALQMAVGVTRLFGVSLGIATTGYAEPSPGDNVQEPFAYVAADLHGRQESWRIDGGDRCRKCMQRHVAAEALRLVVEWIEGGRQDD